MLEIKSQHLTRVGPMPQLKIFNVHFLCQCVVFSFLVDNSITYFELFSDFSWLHYKHCAMALY